MQSRPKSHVLYCAPSPPSSQTPLLTWNISLFPDTNRQSLKHTHPASSGGGGGKGDGGMGEGLGGGNGGACCV